MTGHIRKHYILFMFTALFTIMLSGCGGGGSTHSDGGSSSDSTGTVAVSLTDATTDTYAAVYISIDRVEVRSVNAAADEAEWETVATTPATTNLLELVNGVRQKLGETTLKEGIYTQMRLILDTEPVSGENILGEPHPFAHYTIASDTNTITELKVPNALSSGIKLNSVFSISGGETTDVVIDFDASRSVVETGSDKHLLRPVLKAFEPQASASLSGGVAQSDTQDTLEGCYISAQNPIQPEEGEELIAPSGGTLSDTQGQYSLRLEPGDLYLILAYKHGYQAQCFGIESQDADAAYTLDFTLDKLLTAAGVVSGEVSVSGQDADSRYATIQVRRNLLCQNENGSSENHAVIIKSVNIAHNNHYRLELPPGQYRILAFAPEYPDIPPLSRQINLHAGAALTEHISLR